MKYPPEVDKREKGSAGGEYSSAWMRLLLSNTRKA